MNAAPESLAPIASAGSVRATAPSHSSLLTHVARAALFLWTILIGCPIRYWPLDDSIDNTWVFAMNYAAAHGLAIGRDVVWTTGPLGYLVFPQDIGANLGHALLFQGALWTVLIILFADLFYCAGVALRNLVFFTLFFSLSAPLFWFNYMGLENLLLTGVLVLLVVARLRDGAGRYVVALALAGVIPLIKLTGAMLAFGAVLGFLLDRAIRVRKQVWREIALALVVPLAAVGIGCWILLPSFDSFTGYLRANMDVAGGYAGAMSNSGDPVEFGGVAEVILCIGAFLFVRTRADRRIAWFFVALLTIPLLISVKHGFTRQDTHVINFFCFGGLALGLIALAMPLNGRRAPIAFLVLLSYGLISLEYMIARIGPNDTAGEISGLRGASMALGALRPADVRATLRARSQSFAAEARVEPPMRALIADSPVASLSVVYSGALLDGLNLKLYPVVQRYSAYTPYLDRLNAAFIRDKGPRFLLFDGLTIDHRHPWTETPAMWLEVYRWYNTRLLGDHSLLLERRTAPRFEQLKVVGHLEMSITSPLDFSASPTAVFWTMRCRMNFQGSLQKMLFRIPEVTMRLGNQDKPFRIIPEVMDSPMLAEHLPSSLSEFASVLDEVPVPVPNVKRIQFGGPGLTTYGPACQVEFLAPL